MGNAPLNKMTEFILTLIIVALGVLIGWLEFNNRKERKNLINALIAKTSQELAELELVDKTKIKVEKPTLPDLTAVEDLSDEDFGKYVLERDAENK